MPSITGALKDAGFVAEKSTVGDKVILVGIYKCLFVDWKDEPEGKFGPQLMAKFQITTKLSGMDSRATFPQFTDYYKTDAANVANKRRGLGKLIDGFLSVGITIDHSTDELLFASLESQKGSAEVFIKASVKEPIKEEPKGSGNWVPNPDGEDKQAFSFLTEKNAVKLSTKEIAKAGHPL